MNIHFVGCLGVSMRALMDIAASFGHTVTGSDINLDGHDEKNVEGKDAVVYTAAVGEDNEEVACARKKGLKVYERAEFLGMASLSYERVIAVSGCHGKTTATGFLESIFIKRNPTVHIGGTIKKSGAVLGGRKYFITEACEYKRSFLKLKPHISLVLNAELDHTDYYRDEQDYESAFADFISKSGISAVCGDDKGIQNILRALSREKHRIITYGFNKDNDFYIDNVEKNGAGYTFRVYKDNRPFFDAETSLPGRHNLLNALGASIAALCEGITLTEIKDGISSFAGIKRRFELLGEINGAKIYTDYAHHPTEIKASIAAARENGAKKVTFIFEPHTYTRTNSLLKEFTQSLSLADRIVAAPVFAAREKPIKGVSSHNLILELIKQGKHAVYIDTYYMINRYIKDTAEDGEFVIYAGAGTINAAAKNIADNMRECL